MIADEVWRRFARLTPARIALGRTGAGLPTDATLNLALAHAQARDAVHASLDTGELAAGLDALGLETLTVASRAVSRQSYLLRPDLGRQLDAEGKKTIATARQADGADLALVIADGLSARAVHAHAVAFVASLLPYIHKQKWTLSPVVLVTQGRVAIGDEIGALLGARLALVMIGERPGLSSPDSLGLYITYGPEPGRQDSQRNCISNIHGAGISAEEAAYRASWLIGEAFSRRLTGVKLKDESGTYLPGSTTPAAPELPAPDVT